MPPAKQPQNGPWEWFTEKVLPGLFLAVALAVGTSSMAIYQSVTEISNTVRSHEQQLIKLEARTADLVTRTELLETLKRVEQQMQIVLLQSGIKTRIRIE